MLVPETGTWFVPDMEAVHCTFLDWVAAVEGTVFEPDTGAVLVPDTRVGLVHLVAEVVRIPIPYIPSALYRLKI